MFVKVMLKSAYTKLDSIPQIRKFSVLNYFVCLDVYENEMHEIFSQLIIRATEMKQSENLFCVYA